MAHFRADLTQAVASTQNRKCLRVLPVQQEVLLGTSSQIRSTFGVLQVKLEVLVVSTGSASSHFQSMAYGPIKASTTETFVLNKRSVVLCFVVLNCLSLVTHVVNDSSVSRAICSNVPVVVYL